MKGKRILALLLAVIVLSGTIDPIHVRAESTETTVPTETTAAQTEPTAAPTAEPTTEPSVTPTSTDPTPVDTVPASTEDGALFEAPPAGPGEENSGTVVNVTLAPDIAGKTEYLTNEQFVANFDIDLSSATDSILNPTIVITMPSTYLGVVNPSDLQGQTSKTIVTSGGITTITYKFSQLTGGTTMRIPMVIQTKAFDTPNGYVLPINASLLASDGSVIKAATELDITSKVVAPTIIKNKIVSGVGAITADGSSSFGGTADPNNTNLISTIGASNQVFSAYVSVNSGNTTNSSAGCRKYSSMILTDTLPAGAVFTAADNPGWTYDTATNTATYTQTAALQYGSSGGWYNCGVNLNLKFPGADIRNSYTNTMKAEFIPDKMQSYETSFTSTDSIVFKLNTTLPGVNMTKYCNDTIYDSLSSKSKILSWTLYIGNNAADMNTENIVLSDTALDSRLQYVSAQLSTASGVLTGTVNIEAIDSSGASTLLASNVPATDQTVYPIPAGTVKVRLSSTSGSYLSPNKYLYLVINTKLIDPANTHTSVITYFTNNEQLTENYQGISTQISGTSSASVRFIPYTPKIFMIKSVDKTTALVNDVLTYTLNMGSSSGAAVLPPDVVYGQQIVDLLPQGLTYVAGSAAQTNPYSVTGNNNLFTSNEPTVTANYKGTGRTALIWTFSKPINGRDYSYDMYFLSLSFQAKVLKETQTGSNLNQAYFTWSNNGTDSSVIQQVSAAAATGSYVPGTDTLDIDGDGNTAESVLAASAAFTYIPPREVIASKYVKGSLDSTATLTGGRTQVGDSATYSLKVFNNSLIALDKLTAIDVLPFVGDLTIAPDTNGVYQPRNSAYAVHLTGPVVTPAGYTVYYTSDLPTSTPANYANNAAWVLTPSDYSAVKGIKVVMNTGTTLAVAATVSFDVPVGIPSDMTLQNGQTANNSFAISVNNTDYLEATMSSLTVVRYAVTGTVFEDQDSNSLMAASETKLGGIKVWLVDNAGSPVLDLDGNPIKTTTAADGTYKLDVFRPGQYSVCFQTPDNYTVTAPGAITNVLASHIKTTNASTALFSLNATTSTAIRNAGFNSTFGAVQIVKVLKDNAGQTLTAKRDFSFDIFLNNVLYTGDVEINGVATAVTNGRISIQNGDTVWIRDVLQGTNYEIREVNASNYTVVSTNATGTVQAYDKLVATFTNTEKALGQLTITKILKDGAGTALTEAKDFSIVVTGPSYLTGQMMILTSGTPLVLTGLIYGTYSVTETGASDYTVSISDPVALSVSAETQSITVTNTEKALGQLTITKILKDNAGTIITAAKDFSIVVTGPSYPTGQTMTLTNGTPLVLTGLIYGTYTVTETGASDYTVSISNPVALSASTKTGSITVTNTEKALGQLTITKVIDTATLPGEQISFNSLPSIHTMDLPASRSFTIVVTGPSYLTGQTMTLTSGTPLVLTGLIYGTYSVVETGADDYTVSISDPATLSVAAKTGSITVTNTEKALGQLTITKVLKDNAGTVITGAKDFSIIVTGPDYPTGQTMTLTNGTPLVLTGLIYGSYTVTETGASDYTVAISDPATLSVSNKTGSVTVTNTEKALGQLTITKVIDTATLPGDKIKTTEISSIHTMDLPASRSFTIVVTGPSYPTGQTMTLTSGTPLVLTGLIYGTYSVVETGADDYSVSISDPATLSAAAKTGSITVINTEKALGQLTITKEIDPATLPGDKITTTSLSSIHTMDLPASRSFTIVVTGPSYPSGETMTLTSGTPLVLTGLIYGIYSVVETGADDYTVSISDPVTLSVAAKTGNITVINTEKALGQLTITKIYKDSYGAAITEAKDFTIVVTGPSYPDGQGMTLTNGTPLVLTGLIYGTYSVKETNTVGFTATVSAPATLDVSNKEGAVTVTNVLDALIFPSPVLGELTINKVLKDASGNKLTENLSFTVKVTGPSYPDGKTFTVSTAEPLVIKGLIYGTYTVEEQGADKYTSAVSAPVTFSATVTTGSITVTNTEKALGELTITKVLKDNTGTVLTENKTFNILVTGPSYPNGQTFTVSTTEPLVIKGLIYGNYTIVEQNAADYTVSYSGPLALSLPVSLTMNFLSAAITITNVQKTGTLGISKDVSKPSSVGGVAKTGETNQPYYLAGMGAMALAGAAILLLLRKRKSTGQ